MALAAFRCHIRRHGVLAVPLTTFLRPRGTLSSHLQAGEARPGHKKEEGQGAHTGHPEAMSLRKLHLAVETDLLFLGFPVNLRVALLTRTLVAPRQGNQGMPRQSS